jgi:dolichol-phosphate mannosyltransferase
MKLSIIIPSLNEEGNIERLFLELDDAIDFNELLFVDDGSKDRTLSKIKDLCLKDHRVKYVSFTRNFGHQAALLAGYRLVKGDVVLTMDGDLQHPVKIIPEMMEQLQKGYDVVNAVRDDSEREPSLKKMCSYLFYRLFNFMSDVKLDQGSADFRLITRRVLIEITKLNEKEIFFRGMVNWMGFRSCLISYKADQRSSGNTKYSFYKMLKLTLLGLTSLSTRPLIFSFLLGMIVSSYSFIYICYALYVRFFTDKALDGWTSIMISILFLGGVQLISLGVISTYISKMFLEIKGRPSYLINDTNTEL